MKQFVAVFAVVFSVISVIYGAEPQTVLKAGAAQSVITPPLGEIIVGSGGMVVPTANYIHDDLHARCLVLSNGKTTIAFVVCDLLGVARSLSDKARQLAEQRTGIPAENIVISAVHNHSGTSATPRIAGQKPSIQGVLSAYGEFVAVRIADAIACAAYTLRPAQVGWTSTMAPEHVFCRRWYLKPETMPANPFGSKADKVRMNPGYQHPGLDRPSSPVDPEVGILAARTPEGLPIGMLANYSLHYVGGVPRGEISADYYGIYNNRMRQLLGAEGQHPPFVSLMSNGTSGNINNIDYSKPAPKHKSYEKMGIVAEDIAQKVFAAYQKIVWHDQVPLGVSFEDYTLDVRHPTPEQLAWAKDVFAREEGSGKMTQPLNYARRVMRINQYPSQHKYAIQTIRVGDLGITTFPFEIFTETGLELKAKNPFKHSFTISLAHGYHGYMPTPEQHLLGGYETWLGVCQVSEDSSVKLVDRLLAMLTALKQAH